MTDSLHTQQTTSLDAVGKIISTRLSESTDQLPHDITERLKSSRMQALSKRKISAQIARPAASILGAEVALNMGSDDRSLWNRIASYLPLLTLIAGLMAIGLLSEDQQTNEIADIDVEILTGDLPPAAYTDPGFAQFLRANRGK
jgi:hypothetical protein